MTDEEMLELIEALESWSKANNELQAAIDSTRDWIDANKHKWEKSK